jgi:ParB family chromosome partitioning protein
MTHDEIAHTVGRSRASVTNTLRLLSLEASVRRLLEEGRLDMGHARALLTLDLDQQPRVAMIITDKQLNVREAEQLVNTEKYQQPGTVSENKEPQFYQAKCEEWSKELSKRFSAKVSVKLSARGTGKVVIEVASPDEINWFVDHVYVK